MVGREFLGFGGETDPQGSVPCVPVCSLWKTQAEENQKEFSPTARGISACSNWKNILDTTRASENQSPVGFQSSVIAEVCLSHCQGNSDLNKIKQGSLAIGISGSL